MAFLGGNLAAARGVFKVHVLGWARRATDDAEAAGRSRAGDLDAYGVLVAHYTLLAHRAAYGHNRAATSVVYETGEGTAMASLEVSALARAAAAWPPIGVTSCAPGHHPTAGQVASGPAAPVRSRAPPSAIPAGSQPARGAAVPSPRIRRHLVPDQSLQAGGNPLLHKRRKDGM